MLSAFLIMISSVFTLMATSERTGVYLNVGAMFCLVIAISVMNSRTIRKNGNKMYKVKRTIIWATAP